jgi:hypothetical protein
MEPIGFHASITFVNDNNSHLGLAQGQTPGKTGQTQTLGRNPVYNFEPINPDLAGYRMDINHARRNPQ